jgi:type I restriction enzyme R subunit
MKLRQFGEALAQLTAAQAGMFTSTDERQADLLRQLYDQRVLPHDVANLFHQLRQAGNRATHAYTGDYAEALSTLKFARQLGIWFHRTFADPGFAAGPFVPPPDPAAATQALQEELAQLRQLAAAARSEAEQATIAADAAARERMSAEERARQERDERALWEQLAVEAEQAKAALAAQLQAVQAAATSAPTQAVAAIVDRAEQAATRLNIDEATTRTLIDAQLRACRWEVDTATLRYSAGTRPAKGRNMAIAEWPTSSGPADYALFVGTQCIGVIEAKRRNRNVSSAIDQA